jgi:hypothetical protein
MVVGIRNTVEIEHAVDHRDDAMLDVLASGLTDGVLDHARRRRRRSRHQHGAPPANAMSRAFMAELAAARALGRRLATRAPIALAKIRVCLT